jgi:putative two-component system response regulator
MRGPILAVDDEPINLARLRNILESQHELVFARNGEEALQAVAKHHPALILLDVQMPLMDGYEVCRRLKANPATEDIPVIFVTSLGSDWNEETGFDAGCVDYITKPISPVVLKTRVRTHLSLVREKRLEASYRDAIFMLGEAGHYNDTDTGVHIWRMAAYSRTLAEAMGWKDERAVLMELAAPMHDTGKIGVPDAVLKKQGPLNADDWHFMRCHPRIGYDILRKSNAPVFQLAAEIAYCHHEKWDGSGYPRALAGEDIPQSARIVAVADVFDALSMKRPYKEPWPLERVISHLNEGSGKHFDPAVIAAFHQVLPTILQIQADWNDREQHG